jgi:hypothetical protein
MPGDPKECRQQALACMLLAKEAHTEQGKRLFHELAQSWFRLAIQHEDAQSLLSALNGMTFDNAIETTLSIEEEDQRGEAA